MSHEVTAYLSIFNLFKLKELWPYYKKHVHQIISSSHMHGLTVYVKEGLPFAWDVSLENSADSYLCFRLALLRSLSYFAHPSKGLAYLFWWT